MAYENLLNNLRDTSKIEPQTLQARDAIVSLNASLNVMRGALKEIVEALEGVNLDPTDPQSRINSWTALSQAKCLARGNIDAITKWLEEDVPSSLQVEPEPLRKAA